MKCKLITTVSDPRHPGWLKLKYSLDKFGWDYAICGTEYHQFGSKMVNAYNYAKKTDCTHLFIVDAYDVVVLGTMSEAVRNLPMDAIVFNAERNAWPYEQWFLLYPECKSSFKYLNGGMSFVSVYRFLNMFGDNPILHTDNDQVVLAKTFLLKRDEYNMRLDTNCDTFQTLCGTDWGDFRIQDGKVFNRETGSFPLLIHGNGKHPMDKIIDLL